MDKNGKVTIIDVARKAGVSKGTVDRVVHNRGEVSRKSAEKVRKAIEELGRRGALSVLCEGGLKLARSLADAGLVDQWVNVFAPILIGSRPIAKAVRGKFNEERSFANGGDRFLTADFGAWATGFGD